MAEPVLGTDAILQIYKAGSYRDFLCATDVSIDFKTDVKSVKTIGDGVWKRSRPQAIGYSITLSGLIKLNTGDDPAAFDVLDYQTSFTDLQYRITFKDSANTIKAIFGYALVESTQLGGGSEGFATGSFTLVGNGQANIIDGLTPCDVTITDISFSQEAPGSPISVFIFKSGAGTVLRYEYSIGGIPTGVSYENPFIITTSSGSKSFTVTPICSNGFEGTARTETYVVI